MDTLRRSGATRVIVMGAGLGGHSALWAASRPGVDLAGVIAVSAPQLATGGPSSYDLSATVLRSISEPKLFIAGDGAEAEARDDARSMYGASVQPKELTLLPSSEAGPELFTQGSPEYVAHADQVVLDFLAATAR